MVRDEGCGMRDGAGHGATHRDFGLELAGELLQMGHLLVGGHVRVGHAGVVLMLLLLMLVEVVVEGVDVVDVEVRSSSSRARAAVQVVASVLLVKAAGGNQDRGAHWRPRLSKRQA